MDTKSGLHVTATVQENGAARLVVHFPKYVQIIALTNEERRQLRYMITHESDDEALRAEFAAVLEDLEKKESSDQPHDFKLLSIEDHKKGKT